MNIQLATQPSLSMYAGAAAANRVGASPGAAVPPAAAAASLEKLAELIQRLWLFPGDMASNHKSYRALMDWMIAAAPSAAAKAALLSVVGHVNRGDYLQALTALRAIAV